MSNEQPLAGETALVTGSGRGLGFFIARRLAQLGARVAIHDVSEDAPAEYGEFADLAEAAQAAGAVAFATGHIAAPEAIEAIAAKAEAALGGVSLLVNCAGGDIAAAGGKPRPNDALGVKREDIHAMLDRNLIGTILMCQRLCPSMIARGHGAVVNIASSAAHVGVSEGVIYAVAKAGVVHFTRCLAAQLRPHGIRANALSPGPTKTARFAATRVVDPAMMSEEKALVRYGTPDEIADAAAFLVSPASRFVSGQVLRVDGAGGLYAG